jgi:hypothetical protein
MWRSNLKKCQTHHRFSRLDIGTIGSKKKSELMYMHLKLMRHGEWKLGTFTKP